MQTRRATTTRPKVQRPMTPTQRHKTAEQQVAHALGASDTKLAVTAALEALGEQLGWDTNLRARASEKYQELQALANAKANGAAKRTPASKPTPIKGPDLDHYSPYGRLNPYQLLEGYGRDQLRAVLETAPADRLREAVSVVQEREPGTAPAGTRRKIDMVDFIVEHVAGSGY